MIGRWAILVGGIMVALVLPGAAHAFGSPWSPAAAPSSPTAAKATVEATRFSSHTLDQRALRHVLASAPLEGRGKAVLVEIPAPRGRLERFEVRESPVLEPKIAAENPQIGTYTGRGVSDPTASVRLDLTPLGFHASVLSERGAWNVEPLTFPERGTYASFWTRDVPVDSRGELSDDLGEVDGTMGGTWKAPNSARVAARRGTAAGGAETVVKRVYRIALVNDPTFAAYYGGGDANVLAAKAALVNRVNLLFNDDLAIEFRLVEETNELNFATDAEYSEPNGPCGDAPCFTADTGCTEQLMFESAVVTGQLVGADDFEVGHFLLGDRFAGGIAYLGAISAGAKAFGCTGMGGPGYDPITNDPFVHELGHQFGSHHTFNGCGEAELSRSWDTAVEPGGGSSVMSYAGICGPDNLQGGFDPIFSQRSIDRITDEVTSYNGGFIFHEFQTASFAGFSEGDSFRIGYGGETSPPITNGVNYTEAGIKEAIESIPGWPQGGSAVVLGRGWEPPELTAEGFQVSFEGTLKTTDVPLMSIEATSGFTAVVGETARGGKGDPTGRNAPTGNNAPVVGAQRDATIPVRTPFELEGRGTDEDGDPLVYSWEQNERMSYESLGTALFSSSKSDGPLFRIGSEASLGKSVATSSPVRVFPDAAQIAAGDTNAARGTCVTGNITCFSEFLPTSSYADELNFRLTARDRAAEGGGLGHDDVTLALAKSAGPFRVISHVEPATLTGGDTTEVRWDVAGTSSAPVSAENVDIFFSADGGLSFPIALESATSNDGSATVQVPNIATSQGRFKVKAAGNVFFDISHSDVTVQRTATPTDVVPPETTITGEPSEGTKVIDPIPEISFSANEPAEFKCSINEGPYAPCSSSEVVAPLPQGVHTFSVYAMDVAGNVDGSPAVRTFRVGTEAPVTTITGGPSDGATITEKRPKFSFEADEPSEFLCTVDGGVSNFCTSPKSLGPLTHGPHTFSVYASDDRGYIDSSPETRSFTVVPGPDEDPPETRIDSGPRESSTIGDTTPTFEFSSDEPGSTFECSVDASPWEICTSPFTTAPLSDGFHYFGVRATDAAGNYGSNPIRTFSVLAGGDITPPETTIVTGPAQDSTTNDPTPVFTFSSEYEASFQCSVDGGVFTPCTSPFAMPSLQNGPHAFAVKASDAAGNTDTSPASRTFNVSDTTPPETTILSGPPDSVTIKRGKRDRKVRYELGSDEGAVTFECNTGGGWQPCLSAMQFTLRKGTWTLKARATDVAGNTDGTPVSHTLKVEKRRRPR